MEHNEILGMDAALKYINQTLVDKIGDITLQVSLEVRRLWTKNYTCCEVYMEFKKGSFFSPWEIEFDNDIQVLVPAVHTGTVFKEGKNYRYIK